MHFTLAIGGLQESQRMVVAVRRQHLFRMLEPLVRHRYDVLTGATLDEPLRKPNVVLMNEDAPLPADGYVVLECFPTSVWRASGLTTLPGKRKHPALAPYVTALSDAYMLPRSA